MNRPACTPIASHVIALVVMQLGGGRGLSGMSASFKDPVPAELVRNGRIELEVFVADEGGNITRTKDSFGY